MASPSLTHSANAVELSSIGSWGNMDSDSDDEQISLILNVQGPPLRDPSPSNTNNNASNTTNNASTSTNNNASNNTNNSTASSTTKKAANTSNLMVDPEDIQVITTNASINSSSNSKKNTFQEKLRPYYQRVRRYLPWADVKPMTPEEKLTLSWFEKWIRFGRFPFKFVLHTLVTIFCTVIVSDLIQSCDQAMDAREKLY